MDTVNSGSDLNTNNNKQLNFPSKKSTEKNNLACIQNLKVQGILKIQYSSRFHGMIMQFFLKKTLFFTVEKKKNCHAGHTEPGGENYISLTPIGKKICSKCFSGVHLVKFGKDCANLIRILTS